MGHRFKGSNVTLGNSIYIADDSNLRVWCGTEDILIGRIILEEFYIKCGSYNEI